MQYNTKHQSQITRNVLFPKYSKVCDRFFCDIFSPVLYNAVEPLTMHSFISLRHVRYLLQKCNVDTLTYCK